MDKANGSFSMPGKTGKGKDEIARKGRVSSYRPKTAKTEFAILNIEKVEKTIKHL